MIRLELSKLYKNKMVCSLLLILVLSNFGLFWLSVRQDALYAGGYKHLYTTMRQQKQPSAWLKEEQDKSLAYEQYDSQTKTFLQEKKWLQTYGATWVKKRKQEAEKLSYEDRIDRQVVLQQLDKERQAAKEYPTWKQTIVHQQTKNQDISIFHQNSKTKAISQKTAQAYARIPITKLSPQPEAGIKAALQFTPLDVLVMLALVVCASQLISKEREQGSLRFMKSLRYGNGRLFLTKAVLLVVLGWGIYLLMMAGTIGLSILAYGKIDVFVPVQALSFLSATPYAMTIFSYLLAHMGCVLLSITLLTMLLMALSYAGFSPFANAVIALSIYGGFSYLYQNISILSPYAFLHEVNLFAFLHPQKFLSGYDFYMLAGHLLSKKWTLLVLPITSLFCLLSAWKMAQKEPKSHHIWSLPTRKESPTTLWQQEGKKLFIKDYGLLMLAMVFLLCTISITKQESVSDPDDAYYNHFVDTIGNKVSREGKQKLKKQEEAYSKWQEAFQKANDLTTKQVLSQRLASQTAFETYKQAYEQRQYQNHRRIIAKEDHYRLFYEETTNSKLCFIAMFASVLFMVTRSYHREKHSHMLYLQDSSTHALRVRKQKSIWIALSVCIVNTMLQLCYVYKILTLYPDTNGSLPVQDLQLFFHTNLRLPMVGYLLLMLVNQWLWIWLWTLVLSTIMRRWNQWTAVLILGFLLMVLPILLPDMLQSYGLSLGYHLFYPHRYLMRWGGSYVLLPVVLLAGLLYVLRPETCQLRKHKKKKTACRDC